MAEIELEAKRITDCSWHPCQVSLRSGGGLSVKFEGQESEDLVFSVEDAFSHLRVRSSALQADDCCYIEEGNHVLAACQENSQRLFFDAVVEKALRVRHSKRACCRCTFMVKWLFQEVGNECLTVPSGSILKLAAESIKTHPVVAAFLDSVGKSPLSSLPSSTVFDETEGDIDLHGLLGRQIEEIGNLADLSKTELLKNSLQGVDQGVCYAGMEGQTKFLASEKESKLQVEVSCRQSHLRRSGRKQNKTETKAESLIISAPSSADKSGENRSPLSPLAARAVLASLVSKIPQKFESVHNEEGKHVSVLDYTAHNHVSLEVVDGMMISGSSDSHIVNSIDSKNAILVDNAKSHRKTKQGASGKKLCAHKSSDTFTNSDGILPPSIRNEELIQSVRAGRLTRSAIKRDSGTPSGEGESRMLADRSDAFINSGGILPSSIRDEELIQPGRAGRLTRSAIKRDSGTPSGEVESRLLPIDVAVARASCSGALRNAYLVDEVKETIPYKPARVIVAALTATKRESGTLIKGDKSRTLDDKGKVTFSCTRMTRSAAHKGTGALDGKVKEALQDTPETESAQSDNAQESNSTPDLEVSAKKRDHRLVSAERNFSEANKKQKGSNDVEKTHKTPVEGLVTNVENHSQKKTICSTNQPMQFSSRPLTRSQAKS